MSKLAIIVPFRDRYDHLKKFIPHMESFFDQKKINVNIFVVEQVDDKPFNRAKLLNIGFAEIKDDHDYFCFHDVDLLPVNNDCDYSYIQGVCKLSYYVSQFNFQPRPTDELGGVTMFDKDSYIEVNGYSNDYWGWGVEDNDLGERCKRKQIPFSLREGRYLSLPHKPNGDTMGTTPSAQTNKNRKYFSETMKSNNFFQSGLSSLDYRKVNEEKNKFYTKIMVEL
tara:strand:+ start:868 stop:1539 length:672 start_codon:yes stop_codon:yes gene_type:complete